MSELIADFFTVQFAVAIGIALMGGTIFGFAGFAAGLSMVPLLAWVYDPPTALAIVGMAVAIGAAQLLPHGIRNADWPTVGPILLAALIGVPCGTVTLLISEPETVRRVIGGLLVVFALIMLSGWTYNGPRNLMTNLFVGVSSGALSGFMSGGGSIVSSYFVSWPGSVTQTRANIYMVTYSLAVLAHHHHVPFYVAAPLSTVDYEIESGTDIPVEERAADEVTRIKGVQFTIEDIDVTTPAFDVTPAELIHGIITEKGVAKYPYKESLEEQRNAN